MDKKIIKPEEYEEIFFYLTKTEIPNSGIPKIDPDMVDEKFVITKYFALAEQDGPENLKTATIVLGHLLNKCGFKMSEELKQRINIVTFEDIFLKIQNIENMKWNDPDEYRGALKALSLLSNFILYR